MMNIIDLLELLKLNKLVSGKVHNFHKETIDFTHWTQMQHL